MRDSSSRWTYVFVSLVVLSTCGCAAVGLEAIEADEALSAAGAAARVAPELAEAAPEIAGGGIFTDLLDSESIPSRGFFVTDGDVPGLYVDGNHLYDIDLSSGTIKTSRGIEVAQIEEDRIYRTYPKGAHELIAKVETRFAEPTPMYAKDPTDLTRVRMLETNDLVQIVEARDGWYQLRYVDESGNAILYWAFAPMLLTNVNRDGQSNFQPITFTTRPSKRAVLRSTLESAERVQRDIHTILSGLPNGG